MKTDLFHIGKFVIHGYGLMIGIGFVLALLVGEYRAKKMGMKEEALIVAPILDSMSLIFPASKVSAGDVEDANRNVLSDINGNILTDEVYLYSKNNNCLVAPAYKL